MSIEAKVSRLTLDLKHRAPQSAGTLPEKPVDETPESWEDQAIEDASPVEAPGPSLRQITSNDGPAPPPPTPISPHSTDPMSQRWDADSGKPTPRYSASSREDNDRRPEKTTATANRMIAGALGIRAPKKTEDQKQYDKAAREAENKRRNREKEQREQEKLDEEKAKAAMWDA